MTTDQAPQTFEEHLERAKLYFAAHIDIAADAFAAGVASQQAEIERLNDVLERYREIVLAGSQILAERHNRYEAVVEAAREPDRILMALINAHDWPAFSSPAMRRRIEEAATGLRAALTALESDGT